ncbi:hypothetical protein BDZ94DRAFT_1235960 [Collybia nuda]|uniref:Uncharacterized protein n=1 Tax=Collybia nuda TaxID=64659 RepID=A0A9P5Y7M4_9AGAR|nr:hypothetical protein BDZ94DRAFT_1235960 [Collybia nuda]
MFVRKVQEATLNLGWRSMTSYVGKGTYKNIMVAINQRSVSQAVQVLITALPPCAWYFGCLMKGVAVILALRPTASNIVMMYGRPNLTSLHMDLSIAVKRHFFLAVLVIVVAIDDERIPSLKLNDPDVENIYLSGYSERMIYDPKHSEEGSWYLKKILEGGRLISSSTVDRSSVPHASEEISTSDFGLINNGSCSRCYIKFFVNVKFSPPDGIEFADPVAAPLYPPPPDFAPRS